MSKPAKVTVEISATGYSVVVLDSSGGEMWRQDNEMLSAGQSRAKQKGSVFDAEALDDYGKLQSEVDDLSFGPFGVAAALYNIAAGDE